MRQQAMYFPCLGSHLAIMEAFSAEITGAYEESMKWILGYGTRLVWNSVISTLRAPSNLREAVREEITWATGVLKEGVSGEDGVVRLNDGGGDLGGGVDGESELGFLTVIDGESLEEERSETGSGTSTDGVEDEETLETSALIGELADSVEAEIDDLTSDGVMSSGEVVGGVLLSGDELLGVEQLSVGSGTDLIDDGGLEIEEDGSGDVLAGTSLGEEGVEGIVTATDSLIGGHLAIGLNSVLEAEELPAGVTDLDTGLSNVD